MSYATTVGYSAMQSIAEHAIDALKNLSHDETYGCDFHNEAFNMDYFLIGYYNCDQWLKDNGISVYEAIGIITDYEKSNFGEVSTDFTSSEKVVNMLAYILGEEVINECKAISRRWNRTLGEDEINEAIEEITEEYL